ncbi:MAG TPA: hypothetical protein VMT62_10670 [Syntrophorhabdaceae bacterium]|nr:hypothetical protein [Syntrophorhabdaceae bacterium]
MTKSERDIWFPAKKYGWGWGLPCAWQGWLVTLAYIALVAAAIIFVRPSAHLPAFVGVIVMLTILFCLVCWWKGEKPVWRWGNKK